MRRISKFTPAPSPARGSCRRPARSLLCSTLPFGRSCSETLLVVHSEVRLEGISMAKVPEIIPVTDLRQDASAVLRRVSTSKDPLIITQRGRATAVMLSVSAYERSEQERQILELLARGEKEIAAGKGYDLDDVLAEADARLARHKK